MHAGNRGWNERDGLGGTAIAADCARIGRGLAVIMRGTGCVRGFSGHLVVLVIRHRMPGLRVMVLYHTSLRAMPVRAEQHARRRIAAQRHGSEQQHQQERTETA
jgi:hypothetical protein